MMRDAVTIENVIDCVRFTCVNCTISTPLPDRRWLFGTIVIVFEMLRTSNNPFDRLVLYTVRESVVNVWYTPPGNCNRTRITLLVGSAPDASSVAASPDTLSVDVYESTDNPVGYGSEIDTWPTPVPIVLTAHVGFVDHVPVMYGPVIDPYAMMFMPLTPTWPISDVNVARGRST